MKLSQINEAPRYVSGNPLEDIRVGLIDAIVNGRPRDISTNRNIVEQDEPWFYVNKRNQIVWNWKNREYPLRLMAEHLGIDHLGAYEELAYTQRYDLMNRILNSKQVKAVKKQIKQQHKQSGGRRSDVESEITRLDQKIAQLQAKMPLNYMQ